MGKNSELKDFKEVRDALKKYIVDKKLIPTLMLRSNTQSRNTIYETFRVESESELKGKKLEIWKTATSLVEESVSAVLRADNALSE